MPSPYQQMTMMTSGRYFCFGESVMGASHVSQKMPCQDAIQIREEANYVIACAADGHGSKNCPYSDEGSKAAVQVAADLLDSILQNNKDAFINLDANKEIRLPKQLEKDWKERVKKIHSSKREEPFKYELYGTTLLALAATPDFVFALQIGDGDILTLNRDTPANWFIPPVESVGSETESLCMENCWQYVRTRIMPLTDTQESLMFLLSTDGYANSFTASAGFLKAGDDIFKLWHEEGPEYIKANLKDWLAQSSAEGSGDDITVALVIR